MRAFRSWIVALGVVFIFGFSCLNSFAAGNSATLVNLADINPRIVIDLKYATADNFMKQKVYEDSRCFVLKPFALKLDAAQKRLERDGLGLVVYDGFRPISVQKKMWAVYPHEGFVANPYKGASNHNRAAAVDLSLIDKNGIPLDMPTPFDTFSERAGQFSSAPTAQQRCNRALLRETMERVGLIPIRTEWWHYQLPNPEQYPALEAIPR